MNISANRLKVGIVGLSPGAGAGFVCVNLARAFADLNGWHPAVVELSGRKLYDGLAMDKHFANGVFFNFFHALRCDKNIRRIRNELHGVNWALEIPGDHGEQLSLLEMIRMINNISGNVVLCKISGLSEDDSWEMLREMDQILVVIDPLPSMMLAGYDFLCSLRSSKLPIIYVVNKMNGGVSRKELLEYLRLKKLHFIPMVGSETIYGAEYSCRFVYDLESGKNRFGISLHDVVKGILSMQN